jgi:hypothetical protein
LQLEVLTDFGHFLLLEFSGRQVTQRAVGTSLIVIGSSVPDDRSGLVKAHEPVLIKTFVPKPSVEALHVSIINRLPRRMNCSLIPRSYAQASNALLMNSGPLSTTICSGSPWIADIRVKTCVTR